MIFFKTVNIRNFVHHIKIPHVGKKFYNVFKQYKIAFDLMSFVSLNSANSFLFVGALYAK